MPKIPIERVNPRQQSERFHKEKSDCSVRAFSNALNIPYDEAHKFIKVNCKRKNGTGVRGSELIKIFGENKFLMHKKFGAVPWEVTKYATINQLIKAKPRGRFYILVRGHATSVVDGKLFDTFSKNWKIQKCWEVLQPKINS